MAIPGNQLNQRKQLEALYLKLNDAIERGYPSQALAKLLDLHAKRPSDINVLTLMGRANARMGRHKETIEAYQKASELAPKDADLHFKLALSMQRGGRYEEALVEYERALYYDPRHFYAQRHKSSVLTDLDRLDEAQAALDKLCKQVEGEDIDADQRLGLAISRARFAPKRADAAECIAGIERHIDQAQEIGLRTAGYYQMGRLHQRLEQHDEAFACFRGFKELEKKDWDYEEHSRRVDRLIDCWTSEPKLPFSGVDGSRLIFIVGMMRSGTSLTEQMLAQIEGLTPGGELNAISRQIRGNEKTTMSHGRPLPTERDIYTRAKLRKMANAAMQWYDQVSRKGIVTDKQPYNHPYVPLIAHMFPGCKVIYCMRDPLDCCLSNFSQHYARPHMQTHDLYWLGRYYADYERMMEAWRGLDEVEMLDLRYEELVSDPEGQSKRVLDFLGLPWSEDILRFHESDRTVNTASRDQVRQPMYTSSVKKYEPYEHHLDELKRGLAEGHSRPHGG